MKWLSEEQLIWIHSRLIKATASAEGVREAGLISSALAAPLGSFGGVELYPTTIEKAARLGCGLVQNHPFADGNKRIGLLAMLTVLSLNGIRLTATQPELASLFWGLAGGTLHDEDALRFVRTHTNG